MRNAKEAREYVIRGRKSIEVKNISCGNQERLIGPQWSILKGGDGSTLVSSPAGCSDLTGGYCSTLIGGHLSTLIGGERSTLVWQNWNDHCTRIHTEYVGENGIKANTPYIGYFKNDEFIVEEVK